MSRGMNYQGISVICQGDTTTTGGRVLEGGQGNKRTQRLRGRKSSRLLHQCALAQYALLYQPYILVKSARVRVAISFQISRSAISKAGGFDLLMR